MNGEYDFEHEVWQSISDEGIHFVAHLLQVDPSNRPYAKKATRHPWFRKQALGTLKKQAKANTFLMGQKKRDDNSAHEETDDDIQRTLREADFKRTALNVSV